MRAMFAFGWILAFAAACDDGDSGSAAATRGDFEVVSFEARAGCDDAAAWTAQPIPSPYFRLAEIEVVHTPLLGYFMCATEAAESCADSASIGLSFGRHEGGWASRRGDLRSTDEGCEMEMRAGPLEATEDGGLSLVVSHHQGVLPLDPDDCVVDALEARYAELPCLDQTRWIARRLR